MDSIYKVLDKLRKGQKVTKREASDAFKISEFYSPEFQEFMRLIEHNYPKLRDIVVWKAKTKEYRNMIELLKTFPNYFSVSERDILINKMSVGYVVELFKENILLPVEYKMVINKLIEYERFDDLKHVFINSEFYDEDDVKLFYEVSLKNGKAAARYIAYFKDISEQQRIELSESIVTNVDAMRFLNNENEQVGYEYRDLFMKALKDKYGRYTYLASHIDFLRDGDFLEKRQMYEKYENKVLYDLLSNESYKSDIIKLIFNEYINMENIYNKYEKKITGELLKGKDSIETIISDFGAFFSKDIYIRLIDKMAKGKQTSPQLVDFLIEMVESNEMDLPEEKKRLLIGLKVANDLTLSFVV